MNRNRILFILIIGFITMFGFKLDVYAATELTCVYGKLDETQKGVMLKQDSNGNHTVYYNKKNNELVDKSSSWIVMSSNSVLQDVKITNTESFSECPEQVKLKIGITGGALSTNTYTYTFGSKSMKCTGNDKCASLDKDKSGKGNKEITTVVAEVVKSEEGDVGAGKKCSELSPTPWLNNKTSSKTLSCLYGFYISSGCHIVQLDVGNAGIHVSSNYASLDSKHENIKILLRGRFDKTATEVASLFSGTCPPNIKVLIDTASDYIHIGDAAVNDRDYTVYSVLDGGVRGNNLITGDPAKFSDYKNLISIVEIDAVPKSCNEIIDSKMIGYLRLLVNIFKIIVPVILLVLGSLDLVQAIFSQDEAGIKKAQGKFIKRLIIAVVIFLIPTILHAILIIANNVWSFIDPSLCGLFD